MITVSEGLEGAVCATLPESRGYSLKTIVFNIPRLLDSKRVLYQFKNARIGISHSTFHIVILIRLHAQKDFFLYSANLSLGTEVPFFSARNYESCCFEYFGGLFIL